MPVENNTTVPFAKYGYDWVRCSKVSNGPWQNLWRTWVVLAIQKIIKIGRALSSQSTAIAALIGINRSRHRPRRVESHWLAQEAEKNLNDPRGANIWRGCSGTPKLTRSASRLGAAKFS
jgi:hypothetical protein